MVLVIRVEIKMLTMRVKEMMEKKISKKKKTKKKVMNNKLKMIEEEENK